MEFAAKTNFKSILNNPIKTQEKIGYCHFEGHPGYLTKKLMQEHNCLQKNCKHYEANLNTNYWQKKLAQKNARNLEKELKQMIKEQEDEILKTLRKITSFNELFFIISVEKKDDFFEVRFIKFGYVDYNHYLNRFTEETGERFKLKEISTSFTKKLELRDKFFAKVTG